MKVQRLTCIKFLKSLLLMIARNEITTWGAKQVSDIFKDSETFYIFPNCLDSFIICVIFVLGSILNESQVTTLFIGNSAYIMMNLG